MYIKKLRALSLTGSNYLQKMIYIVVAVTYTYVLILIHLLSDVLATLQVMVSIRKDFWLHNGNNAILEEVTKYKLKANSPICWIH